MKQNTLSIDFKFARVSGNAYTFGYNVYRSVTASTEITVQNWNNKAAIPAYYDKANQRLYAYGVSGYWTVFVDTLTFTSVQPDAERINELETRVGSLETYVNAIVLALNNAIISRNAIGSTASFPDAIAANLNNVSVTITPTQSGSGDPSPSNVRPISGVSSVTVTRTGKNLLELKAESQTVNGVTFTVDYANGTVTANGTATSTVYIKIDDFDFKSGTKYVLSGCPSGGSGTDYYVYNGKWTDNIRDFGDGSRVFDGSETTKPTQTSTDGSVVYVVITSGFTADNLVFRPMVRVATDTDATFEPCYAQSVTTSFVDSNSSPLTVYGGTLDVTTGTLDVTWANIASYGGETLPGRWISDRDVYAPDATPTTGAQVVYELSTPVTYQFTPKNIVTLAGYNAIYASAGSGGVSAIYMSKITLEV